VIGRLLGGRTIGERHPPQDSSGEAVSEETLTDRTPGEAERQFLERTRASFLSQAAAAAVSLREFWSNRTSNAPTPGGWGNLTNLYQQVHSVSLHASLAGCPRIAMLAGILEALLFELVAKPGSVAASLLRTIKQATDCLVRLLEAAVRDCADAAAPNRVLVVDDEERRNDLVVTALRRVGLQAFGTKDPDKALQMLFAEHYDVVPLDINLPGSDGSQPGDRLGSNPRSEKTPTAMNALDGYFEDRTPRVPGAGKELAAQPLNPLEVGLRTVTLYFNSKLREAGDVPASPRSHAADCLGKGFSAGPVLVWIEPFKAGGNGGSAPMADLAPPHDATATAILQ
jgi:CheY-like chemotaxis protein